MLRVGELVGIVLAAGQSERFVGQKGMALLPEGLPMAVRSALNLRAVLAEVICVVRPGDDALQAALATHGCSIIVAEQAAQGMSASLQAGLRAAPTAAGWLVALADMPLIKRQTYQQLLAAFSSGSETAQAQIIVPYTHREPVQRRAAGETALTPGHPVIFPACYRPDLMALRGDRGARSVLRRYAHAVRCIQVDDPGVLQDFDTPSDFRRLFIRACAGES